jgi:hypothetical protein
MPDLFLADAADQHEETVGGASAIRRPGLDVERHHLRAGHRIGVDRRFARTARAPGNDSTPPFQIRPSRHERRCAFLVEFGALEALHCRENSGSAVDGAIEVPGFMIPHWYRYLAEDGCADDGVTISCNSQQERALDRFLHGIDG